MDIPLDAARVGERWVLRRRLPDGSATDLIGWLVAADPGSVLLETDRGARMVVDRAAVIVARRAPAARGGPDPVRTPAAELQQAAQPGWVDLSESLGAWTLRAGGGFTGRANSVLAVGDPGMPLPEAAERTVEYARRHGIAPWAQVIVGSEVEAGFLGLGWRPVHVVTDVLVCRLSGLLGQDLPDPRVIIEERLTPAWWAAYRRSRPDLSTPSASVTATVRGGSVDPAPLRRIVAGQPPVALAAVPGRSADDLIGIARGHVNRSWLGISSVWVDPDRRRQGLAPAMMRALGHWAARRRARDAHLNVTQENTAAHEAYGRLGFVLHHSYRYLAAPP